MSFVFRNMFDDKRMILLLSITTICTGSDNKIAYTYVDLIHKTCIAGLLGCYQYFRPSVFSVLSDSCNASMFRLYRRTRNP